ncbi:MAG: tRNA pseudouridine(55) synthase TruB [Xanthomonadales bacterium]|nr:tRNA pseudouridine(55) synthase TruB [Gammaproteobacteria bacterium]NNK03913.1 tRNA pseudouridine(55) synthase TruB [Xanthomonadales bacterium]
MARRKRGLNIHGVVLLDKPAGISSNRALQKARGIYQARKAGHTGSLDPFATGMLPVCLGEASKTAAFMLEAGKRYRATARLGEATTTGDIEGDIIQTCSPARCDAELLARTLKSFEGQIEQVPPMYSALKHEGRPLYEYARAGIEIERPARTVTIHQLDLVDWQSPNLTFEVHCSKGTYVRTLAEDIATALGSCAHLVALRRTAVEPFESSSMVTLEQLQEAREHGGLQEYLLPVDAGLLHWPKVELDIIQQGRFEHGNQFEYTPAGLNVERVRVYGPENNLLGLADLDPGGRLIPLKVFNL